ncbi:MAG: beta-N-acetylhexosaminidase [Chitinophagaceae bacterium]|nr:MAG: beta-N-acetylhexosaminidase [Chitinophagaceae bacterium]
MKKLFTTIAVLFNLEMHAQNAANIVPAPAVYTEGKSSFVIDQKTALFATTPDAREIAMRFNAHLHTLGLTELPVISVADKNINPIVFGISPNHDYHGISESYTIEVLGKSRIMVIGRSKRGLFYALQTLIQLLPPKNDGASQYPLTIRTLSIKDGPRFPYRGMHLDVARHFSSIDFVKRYIDYLAMYKFNTFHWHLTDDQGWRIEIKKYPLLTQVGGYRAQTLIGPYGTNKYDGKKYGGFYTQQQIKEVVKYAAERFITVIPEIEMPGHALAALASYNYLGCTKGPYKTAETWGVFDDVFCAGNDSTFTFLQNVLDEVMELFPSKLIHIGGDESPKTRWKTCPDCQRRIRDNKLKDEHELQSYFINRIEKYVNSKGRNIIGWDEILEGGLAPNASVMSWRGEEGGITAAKQQHNVVMTPGNYLYFDHSQSNNEDSITFGGYNSLEKVYSYEPIPSALSPEEGKYILGAQANLWTEYITNPKKVEYQLFPRLAALSEVLWSPKEKRNWEDFERRLPAVFDRYTKAGINFSTAYYDIQTKVIPATDGSGIAWQLSTKNKAVDIRFQDYKKYQQSAVPPAKYGTKYTVPVKVDSSVSLIAYLTDAMGNALPMSVVQDFSINKATGKRIELDLPASPSYAGSGGFTLVDAVRNTKGMSKSSQFLGFSGDDLVATIDLGTIQTISQITLFAFEQKASWIYRPAFVSIAVSADGIRYEPYAPVIIAEDGSALTYRANSKTATRFIKLQAKNAGVIADGNPGAGNKAWLFVDEIEVN